MDRIRRATLVTLAVLGLLSPAMSTADVQDQRARLPPPAECTDPVEGVWMSHTFYPTHGLWHIFTLNITHVPGSPTALQGSVQSTLWYGTASTSEPPACGTPDEHRKIDQHAQGTIQGDLIQFGGTDWRDAPDTCGPTGGYNPDRFSGRLDRQRQEFQSAFEDGGMFQGEVTVFRRVRCLEPGAQPTPPPVPVPAPPIYPASRGCGC